VTSVLVDSNVLLDILNDDPNWGTWSGEMLHRVGDSERLVINPIIYNEVSIHYSSMEALDEALPKIALEREAIPFDAAFLAGKAFLAYRRRGGARVSLLPDFLIGAHAAVLGYRLLTRDTARYRTYFPLLGLIAPER
jgi:predicted nucleic acid-binding protein